MSFANFLPSMKLCSSSMSKTIDFLNWIIEQKRKGIGKKNCSTLQNRKTVIHFPWKLHWGFWSGTVLCKTGDETQNPGSLGGGVGWCFLKKEKAMGAFQCISNRMKDHLAFSTYSKTTPKLKNKSSKNKSSKKLNYLCKKTPCKLLPKAKWAPKRFLWQKSS